MATRRRSKPLTVEQLAAQMRKDRLAADRARRKLRHEQMRKTSRSGVGVVWAGRRYVGMLYAAMVLQVAGWVVAHWPGMAGGVAIAGVVLLAVVVLVGRARKSVLFRRCYFPATVLFGTGWLLAASRWGAGAPMPGILFGSALAGGVPWWIHLARTPAAGEPSVVIDDRLERFEAAAPGFLPKGTTLHSLEDVTVDDDGDGEADMLGWAGIVQLPAGSRETWRSIAATRPNLAAVWGVPEEAVEVELATDRVPSRAKVMVLNRRNPSHEINYYDRTWVVLEDGCYPIGVFPDGTRSWQRLYLPGSGPVHALISGDTGSGKSRGMFAAILQAAMTGLCVPFVADPQGGQSIPAWAGPQGKAAWIADNPDEINIMVDALVALMRDRSRRLARREWVDEDGITRVGLDYYDPFVVTDMPIIDWYLDEAKDVLEDRELGEKIEKAARMFRKTGCRMTLGTQYPAIEDLGNRMGLRLQLQTGNVVSYKLGTMIGKTMVLPSWAPNPADIPEIGENGEHTKGMNFTKTSAPGGNRATFNRTTRVKNEHKWADIAVAEKVPEVPKDDQDAMGDAWYQRWERRDAYEHAPVVIDMAHARDPKEPAPIPQSGRAADKILAYLATDGANGRTGVIADRCNMPIGTAGSALKKLAEAGRVVSVGYGVWALPEEEVA